MRISVIIPVYNCEKYIGEAIESVLHQTFKDFELVIVDDGSTDETPEIVDRYAQLDDRIRVIHQENTGRCGSINRGILESRYEWIARLDADDLFLPKKLEIQVNFLSEHPYIKVLGSYYYHINPGKKIIGINREGPVTLEEFQLHLKNNIPITVNPSSVVMHKGTVLDVGLYRAQFKQAEDIDLWNRIAEQGNIILKVPKPLVMARIHEGSISVQRYMEQRIMYKWCRECMFARRNGEPEPTLEEFLRKSKDRPILVTLNSYRKDFAKLCYKKAAYNYATGKYLNTLTYLAGAAMLQPVYTVRRVLRQRSFMAHE